MVNQRGQTTIEYIMMLGLLTVIGMFIMYRFAPPEGRGQAGAIHDMTKATTKAIAEDGNQE